MASLCCRASLLKPKSASCRFPAQARRQRDRARWGNHQHLLSPNTRQCKPWHCPNLDQRPPCAIEQRVLQLDVAAGNTLRAETAATECATTLVQMCAPLRIVLHRTAPQQWHAHYAHHAVAVIDGNNQLLEEPARLVLGHAAPRGHVLVEVAARRILHGQHQVGGREEDLQGHRGRRLRELPRSALM